MFYSEILLVNGAYAEMRLFRGPEAPTLAILTAGAL